MNYQPRWEGGRTVGPQERDCGARYQEIAPHVPRGARVLDFGAFTGYFSHRLADERQARCVAVSPEVEDYPGVTVHRTRMSVSELRALGTFHVTLALSVLHHLDPWQDYWEALLDSAETVIVEVPHPDERFNHCAPEKVREIAGIEGRVLCRTAGYQTSLLRPTMLVHGRMTAGGRHG